MGRRATTNGDQVTSARRKKSRGFTLIELLVVVTIIGILAGIAMVNVRNAQQKARESALKMNLMSMRKAIDDFYADKRKYPSSLQELVDAKYLRSIPKDPITDSADTWIVETDDASADASESEDDMNYTGPGIVDVKSGAEGQTMDNPPIPYGEL